MWESLNNLDFKPVEFDGFRNNAGLNAFTLSPKKWIDGVNAIGIVSKAGRYGGDYANINELLVLSNMENYNAILIDQGIEQSERILTLNKFAKKQLTSIEKLNTNTLKELE